MFRIGEFSRLARVSIKTLRHYDDEGLLRPTHVSKNGYRYYSAAQLDTLQRILVLRDLGFSITEIRTLLVANFDAEVLAAKLDIRRSELAGQIAQDQNRLRRLDAFRHFLLNPAAHRPVVTVRSVPAIEVHAVRRRLARLKDVHEIFESAEASVAQYASRADASPFLVFHDQDYRYSNVDVEVCIPIKPCGPGSVRTIEEIPSAGCLTFSGSYDRAPALYGSMLQWLKYSGLRIGGPLREVYHRFGANQAGYQLADRVLATTSEDYITELQVPVVPSA
jgi:DNA-binding transcriptional MerR regulator